MTFYNGIDPDTQELLNFIHAPMYSKIGTAAMEMDVFTLLAERAKTAAELAAEQGWHEGNTALFLDAVTALGLLEKEEGKYRNTPTADKYLVRTKEAFLGDYITTFYYASRNDDADLGKMVRNGPADETPMTMANVSFTEMAEMMRKMQRGGRSLEVVEMLRGLPEYEKAEKILDLGCGAGLIGIAAVQAHPTLQGVLFDVPQMTEAVREVIAQQGVSDRVTFVAGNYLTDDIGSGYDLVLAIGTLQFAKEALLPLMEKVHKALNAGGVMLCIGDGVHSDGTKPKDILAGWLVSGLQGVSYHMARGMIADAGLKAGFRNAQTLANMPTLLGEMDITVLRK